MAHGDYYRKEYSWSSDESTDLTAPKPGVHRIPLRVPSGKSGKFISVQATCGTAPAGANPIIVDVNKNGTSLWALNQGNRPTIPIGSNESSIVTTFDASPSTYVDNDKLSVDIDQVGNVTPGKALMVIIEVEIYG
jgi:hypothetical protein